MNAIAAAQQRLDDDAWSKHHAQAKANTARSAAGDGVKFGPRPTLTPAQIAHARELIDQDGRTVKEASALLGVHRSTLYRALERSEEVSQAEARRRGAFADDALAEAVENLRFLGGHARKLLTECVANQGITRTAISKAAEALESAGFVFIRNDGDFF